jgi:NlpE N-terminal domain
MIQEEGKWIWLDGSNIELTGIKDRPSKYFVTEGRIIQLDREGKKVTGILAEKYVLTKVK